MSSQAAGVRVASEREAKVLASVVGALLDLPGDGDMRVGGGVHSTNAQTETWWGRPSCDAAGWEVPVPAELLDVLRQAPDAISVQSPWSELTGYFREFLKDLFGDEPETDDGSREDRDWLAVDFEGHEGVNLRSIRDHRPEIHADLIPVGRSLRYPMRPTGEGVGRVLVDAAKWGSYPRDERILFAPAAGLADAYLLSLVANLVDVRVHPSERWKRNRATSRHMRRRAARAVLAALTAEIADGPLTSDLFDLVCAMSSLPYERRQACGTLLFAREHGAIAHGWAVELAPAFDLKEVKRVRKMIEISDESLGVLTDARRVFGLVDARGFTGPRVTFVEAGRWTLSVGDRPPLFEVVEGLPRLLQQTVNAKEVEARLDACFGDMSPEAKRRIVEVAQRAVTQRRGTSLVVTDDARGEASRLRATASCIVTRALDPAHVVPLTRIDGALLFDLDGHCVAFGTIVDGLAIAGGGDAARGARFNSLQRYVHQSKREKRRALALVISEDGHVTWTW